MSEKILVSIDEHKIKTITINHPKAKNAVSQHTLSLLKEAIDECETDGTRVVILTGAEGNFCSGADLVDSTMLLNPKEYDITTYLRTKINPISLKIRELNIPFIAKVKGVAAGVGANFALACDMTFATPDAMFSQIFTNIGLSSDGGGSYYLVKSVGYQKAFELMTTAARLSGEEVHQLGMINNTIVETEIDAYVQKIAEHIANGAYVAMQQTKINLREAEKRTLADALETEATSQAVNFKTDDLISGVMAFMQKKKPNYKGK
ncbi:MAG: enoyl-CoA hydratase [Cytophagales bacterium]|nr:MAG: enoyl-CoA hydratase [Cytophagales bacterium]